MEKEAAQFTLARTQKINRERLHSFSDPPRDLPLPLTSPKVSVTFKIATKPLTPMPVGTLLYLNDNILPLASSCSFGNTKDF